MASSGLSSFLVMSNRSLSMFSLRTLLIVAQADPLVAKHVDSPGREENVTS